MTNFIVEVTSAYREGLSVIIKMIVVIPATKNFVWRKLNAS